MSEAVPALVIGGDPRHGVVRYARELAEEIARVTGRRTAVDGPPDHGAVHVHFTDRLWGASPEAAAARVCELAGRVRLTVTLHDVPQASDGTERLRRRISCYRSVIAAAAAVACNSQHERQLLHETGTWTEDAGSGPTVIPLPVAACPDPSALASRREVAVLGWVYPGKGHAEAIDAVAELGSPTERPAVTALGAPAPGHERDLEALRGWARERGVRFCATGWLDDEILRQRCQDAAIPLAAHTHISASGSISSWIAAGRRPLVADSRYARELEALRPGTVQRYAPARLAETIAWALADPAHTRLPSGADTRPHADDVARTYLAWWAGG